MNFLLSPWTWLLLATLCILGALIPFRGGRRSNAPAGRPPGTAPDLERPDPCRRPAPAGRETLRSTPAPGVRHRRRPLSAFPSWPAATVTVALVGGWLVFSKVWFRRRWPIWLAAATVALTCFAQLALGEVYVTDSVGGIGLSLSFLGFALLLIRAVARSTPERGEWKKPRSRGLLSAVMEGFEPR
ncbi:hypothetical protein G7085_12980 [Tessaracoccus sp. HDW20]|uniref:hypothetical protein n=1 Tax=Tessaracoccus coleopterorum TaxID=2714950 RepID=UPI0018D325D9|nr:hypothetical protein [Tessaracoccus coleopterorum]NHB85231.1 hypothetical protein [Tessaracoccus coleopterorum]